MRKVQVGKVYRHFKGNYYYVQEIGLSSETEERLVIYRALYERSDSQVWVRPEKMFLEKIDENRPDNRTGQKFRFEIAEDIDTYYF